MKALEFYACRNLIIRGSYEVYTTIYINIVSYAIGFVFNSSGFELFWVLYKRKKMDD
jgi:hypothetical protein